MPRETTLVTGASSGIGLELARCFAADGSDLVLVARREDKLADLAGELSRRHGVTARVIASDLADPDGPSSLCERLASDRIDVDVLVNNAGFGARGGFAELPLARQLAMIRLNVLALTELSGRLLPAMIGRGRGGILNVASTAGFQPGPNMAVYYATKAFVLSLSEALSEEARGTGVTVTCLAPGPTNTEFQSEAGLDDALLFTLRAMAARQVAMAGYRGLRRSRALVVPGFRNKLGMLSVRLLPRTLLRKIVARLQD